MKCFKQLGALAVFFFATIASAHEGHDDAEEANPNSDVHALTKDTFKEFINKHPLVLAECTL